MKPESDGPRFVGPLLWLSRIPRERRAEILADVHELSASRSAIVNSE